MGLLEDLLPLVILVVLSIAGKMLESRKNKRRAQSVPQAEPEPQYDSESEWQDDPQGSLPDVAEPPALPPVTEIPDGLKTILRSLGMVSPEAVARIPHPVVEPEPLPVQRVKASLPEPVASPAALMLSLGPESIRAGILWKAALDEPRAKRPWHPVN